MSEDKLYEKAAKRADEKIEFYRFLYGYLAANAFFIILNVITSFGNWWFHWLTAALTIVLAFKFLKVFVLNKNIDDIDRDEMIEKEMEKMRK